MKVDKLDYYLISKVKLSATKYVRWQKTAKVLKLSKKAVARLNWITYYYTKANSNAKLTCRHFGLYRSQWYYWFNRFDETNLRTLEDNSRAPLKTRQKEFTPLQYERLVKLRKQYIRYGKVKLHRLYQKKYPSDMTLSEWKVQSIIQVSGIYYNPQKTAKTASKRAKAAAKKRIAQLKKKPRTGYLICLDSMVRYWNGQKRYIITGIDKYAKLAFARMYRKHSSLTAEDFLLRLYYLMDGNIQNIQTDNGSEFMKHFDQACSRLKLNRYFSRVKTPQDNASNERFNRTLQDEFIRMGNMTENVKLFNQRLSNWLVEYNFNRPHQTLEYLTPIEFIQKYGKVSKMWSSNTRI
jgi:transposase InsO family protein